MSKFTYDEKLTVLAYILQDIEREIKNLEDRELDTLAQITRKLYCISTALCVNNHPESCEVRITTEETLTLVRRKVQQLTAKRLLHRKNLHLSID